MNSDLLEQYKVDAFDAIHFKLIREKDDIEGTESFNPDMTHQVFGESETVFGYRDLDVTINCMAGSLSLFINIKFSEKIPPELSKGVEPDDILKLLKKIYEQEIYTSKSSFLDTFDQELQFRPFGSLKTGYTINSEGHSREFVVHYIDHESEDFDDFSKYLVRMEPFLMFFVDGSNFITLDDRWAFYVLFEKYQSPSSPNKRFAFAGYVSVYKFYAYPENIRPRISQLVILPPFQKMGHATRLLETVYEDFLPLHQVTDITVEDASADFQRVRDFLDCKRCLQLAEVTNLLHDISATTEANSTANGDDGGAEDESDPPPSKRIRTLPSSDNDKPSKGVADRFADVAKAKLKLSRQQSRRIYQILRFFLLPRDKPAAVSAYRNALLKRIKIINDRVRTEAMRGETLQTSGNLPSPCRSLMKEVIDEQYNQELQEQADAEINAYEKTAEKLDAAIKAGELEPLNLQP